MNPHIRLLRHVDSSARIYKKMKTEKYACIFFFITYQIVTYSLFRI